MTLWNKVVAACAGLALSANVLAGELDRPLPPPGARTRADYELVVRKCNTPQAVSSFLEKDKKNIEYVSHDEVMYDEKTDTIYSRENDDMAQPFDTFQAGGGDCKDISNLARDLNSRNHYPACNIAIRYQTASSKGDPVMSYSGSLETGGHMICAVQEGGSWSMVDRGHYRTGFHSIEALVAARFPGWTHFYTVTPDSSRWNNMATSDYHTNWDESGGKDFLPVIYRRQIDGTPIPTWSPLFTP
ncbi:MAG: hypothetical protein AABX47_01260 [Nanoarchaeota archaeon]